MEEHFEVRADIICHYYKGHQVPEIREALIKFLSYTEANVSTEILYSGFLKRQSSSIRELFLDRIPDRDLWEKEGQITSACCREMVKQMNELPDITDDDSFNYVLYHFNESAIVVPQHGIVLNKRIGPTSTENPIIFGLLFSFILSRTATPSDFLTSHLIKTFNRDKGKFEEFLTLMLEDNYELLSGRARTIDLWLRNNTNEADLSSSTQEYTQSQIALSIIYRQMARPHEEWTDGTKEKELQKVAQQFGKSWDTLRRAYNDFRKPHGMETRLKALKNRGNVEKIKKLLGDDSAAIAALNQELIKVRTP